MLSKRDGKSTSYILFVTANQHNSLALLCFLWDTQHAVLYSQSLCLNAAELKITLPWSEALWEAETSQEWMFKNAQEQQQPQYLSALKTYFAPGSEGRTWTLNAHSRVLMLHGIMSVAWDLNRRDQTSLGKFLTVQHFHNCYLLIISRSGGTR